MMKRSILIFLHLLFSYGYSTTELQWILETNFTLMGALVEIKQRLCGRIVLGDTFLLLWLMWSFRNWINNAGTFSRRDNSPELCLKIDLDRMDGGIDDNAVLDSATFYTIAYQNRCVHSLFHFPLFYSFPLALNRRAS